MPCWSGIKRSRTAPGEPIPVRGRTTATCKRCAVDPTAIWRLTSVMDSIFQALSFVSWGIYFIGWGGSFMKENAWYRLCPWGPQKWWESPMFNLEISRTVPSSLQHTFSFPEIYTRLFCAYSCGEFFDRSNKEDCAASPSFLYNIFCCLNFCSVMPPWKVIAVCGDECKGLSDST